MDTSLLHVPDDKLELSILSSQLSLFGSSCAQSSPAPQLCWDPKRCPSWSNLCHLSVSHSQTLPPHKGEKRGSRKEQLPQLLFPFGLRRPVPTPAAAARSPRSCRVEFLSRAAASGGSGRHLEGCVLAELIGLMELCPALRHRLSVLQQRTEVMQLRRRRWCHLTLHPHPQSAASGNGRWQQQL